MHNHDLDLIFSVANDDLSDSLLDSAMTEIASCEECSRELDLQRSGAALLAAVTPETLSVRERDSLRSSLHSELGLVVPDSAPAVPVQNRWRNWSAIAVAAVVLTGVVLVGPLLGLLRGSNDSGTSDGFDQSFAAATIAPADESLSAETQSLSSADSAGSDDKSTSTTALAGEAPPADAAPPEVAAITSEAPSLYLVQQLTLESLETLFSEGGADGEEPTFVRFAQECADSGRDALGALEAMPLAVGTYVDTDAIGIVYWLEGQPDPIFVIHDIETCEILDSTS